jgi:redox-sensitive bicupin YhaK (pirin superfamily)
MEKQGHCMATSKIVEPKVVDLGDFAVRRLLPHGGLGQIGPWVFFDHFGPAEFSAGNGIDVRPHPHINLATVTFLFEGEILHRDSLGSRQAIRPGDLNLMVAGRGITHSERERKAVRRVDHRLHGLQLWHALPAEHEEIAPAFYHHPANELPRFDEADVNVRLMMGSAYGHESPVKTFSPTLYLEAVMQATQALRLPVQEQLAVYVVEGRVAYAGDEISCFHMARLAVDDLASIEALEPSRIVLIGGAAMSRRHIYWNFVSSRPERIERAKQMWRRGEFPTVPGDREEFISLPDD